MKTPLWQILLPALLIALLVAIVHAPVLRVQAIAFDDPNYLLENPLVCAPGWDSASRFLGEVLRPSTVEGYYQPLAMISMMLDYAIAGRIDDLAVYHRTSLLLHAFNAVLVFLLMRRLLSPVSGATAPSSGTLGTGLSHGAGATVSNAESGATASSSGTQGRAENSGPAVLVAAGAAALLFGCHPLTVETVAWIADRKTLLATFFSLVSMLLYLRSIESESIGGNGRLSMRNLIARAASVICFALAVMSKPTAVPLPLLLWLLDLWPLNRFGRRALIEKWPYLVVAGMSAVVTIVSQHATAGAETRSPTGSAATLLAACNLADGLLRMVVPMPASVLHPIPDPLAVTNSAVGWRLLAVTLLTGLLVAAWRRQRAWGVGFFFFAIAIFPTLGLIGFTHSALSDKFVYLPGIGLWLLLAWRSALWWGASRDSAAWRMVNVQRGAWLAAVLLLLGSEIVDVRRTLAHWSDSLTLSDYLLTHAPDAAVLHNHRGWLLLRAGRPADAEQSFRAALRLDAGHLGAKFNLASSLQLQGRAAEAESLFLEVLRLRPGWFRAKNNVATMMAQEGKLDEAARLLEEILADHPDYTESLANLGTIRAMQRRWAEAADLFTRAAAASPEDSRIHFSRGEALRELGRRDDAVEAYRAVLHISPQHAEARARLAEMGAGL